MARITLPPLTRNFLVALIALTLLNAILKPESQKLTPFFISKGNGAPAISIVIGKSYKFPWTFVTACFVEQNLVGLIVSFLSLFFGGRYLERAWGSRDYATFVAVVGILPNVMVWATYWSLYLVSSSGRALHATISGSIAIQSAFLVSFKQLVPEHTVSLAKGFLRLRVKHFPAIHLAANTISGILLGTETAMWLSWSAFFVSWTYLRFYRKTSLLTASATGGESQTTTIKGDASDTFAFAYFFPEPLHTPISIVAEHVYGILVGLKVLAPFSADDVEAGNEQAMARAEGGLPSIMSTRGSGRREEAERRRALALRALDQRLRQGASPGPAGAPATPATEAAAAPSSEAATAS